MSIAIIGITAIVIAAISPYAFEEQCKQKAKEILDSLYSIEGSKEAFLRTNSQGLLSNEGQEELQNLKNVTSQCPNLKSIPEEQSGTDISSLKLY